ncbi:MAG: hypothetical protein CM1200mP10_26350 [Candidatus Neomarinimicrobiota bacterium]|nr:MAG: hypothetical protein CM1200mP10_26350 [Candidatus Neomarinimicrobiota bacterium]
MAVVVDDKVFPVTGKKCENFIDPNLAVSGFRRLPHLGAERK